MRWLLDQGLPRSTAALLREAGDDACHTGERGMAGAADEEIIAIAAAEGRVIVTLDADFHALLAATAANSPSVIRIREEGLKAPDLLPLLKRIESQFAEALAQGCVISYHLGQVRLRRLPIK